MNSLKSEKNLYFTFIVTSIFFFISILSILYHEMWRDELQAWLIARDSHTIFDLYKNLRYDGHPVLWYIILKIIQLFFNTPIAMQIFHIFISTTSVFLFVNFSPFSKIQKILFTFSYFIIYEYTVIARLYTLSILLIILFCIFFPKRFTHIITISIIIFFSMQTNVYTIIIFIVVTFVLILEFIIKYNEIKNKIQNLAIKLIIASCIIISGLIIAIIFIKSAPDESYLTPPYLKFNIRYFFHVVNSITRVFLPLLNFNNNYWYGSGGLGSFFLENFTIYKTIQPIVALSIIIWAILLLYKKPFALLIFIGSITGLLLFYYVIFLGFFRHQGFLFFAFVLSLWISNYYSENELKIFKKIGNAINQKILLIIFNCILLIHTIGGATAIASDIKYTFSYGKKAANFITKNNLKNWIISGRDDFALSTVIGYANIKNAYFAQGNRSGSFVLWDTKRKKDVLTDEELIIKTKELQNTYNKNGLIIVNRPIEDKLVEKYSLAFIALFYENPVIKDEIYGFYIFK